MEQLGSHWTDFHDIRYLRIFLNSVAKTQVSSKYDKKRGTLHEDKRILMISRSNLLRMQNISSKGCREIQNTNFKFNNIFF